MNEKEQTPQIQHDTKLAEMPPLNEAHVTEQSMRTPGITLEDVRDRTLQTPESQADLPSIAPEDIPQLVPEDK